VRAIKSARETIIAGFSALILKDSIRPSSVPWIGEVSVKRISSKLISP
jgi:hypothetical protein